jgi:hypothetical protein
MKDPVQVYSSDGEVVIHDIDGQPVSAPDFIERLKWRQARALVPEQIDAAEWVNGFVCGGVGHFVPGERRPRENCDCGCVWKWKIRGGILLYTDGYVFGKPISIEIDGRMHHFRSRPTKRKGYVASRRFIEEFDCRESYRFTKAQLLEWFPDLSWKQIRKEMVAVKFRKIAVREDGKVVSGFGRDPLGATRLGPFEFYRKDLIAEQVEEVEEIQEAEI